ncbi:Cell division protein FtsN [hydrothermal vent metagenome]|uniref:Cell division protein FtsN n=1 Tax=hydrothermal vent metagenome TaxID=652676 RepID=A0A3B0XSU3_9ZZZZ
MSNKKPVPGYIWMLAGLAIGFFAAFLVYLDKQPADNITFTQAVKQELKKARDKKKQNTAKSAENISVKTNTGKNEKPRFEFYTILSELEVFVPEPEIETEAPENLATEHGNKNISSTKKYLLQAGSFKSHEDAERLKANLALLGVQASIQSVTINADNWHRVRIGPFDSNSQLREALGTLKQNNIHAMTMELK